MKHIGLIVLLTAVTACPGLAQTARKAVPPGRGAERQLIELERQLSDALVREDARVLDRLWSNDLVFTFPNGKVSNKARSDSPVKNLPLNPPNLSPGLITMR